MSLGKNLQFLRKRNDITQEQLAEKLDVSRQSVSKWESDTAYPEMEKIIQLCQMFHCSMDDLIQKDVSTLFVEDKSNYDAHINLFSKMISLGVALILLGVTVMTFFESVCKNDELYAVIFFIFLIIAVAIFIVMGLQHSEFENKNPHIENFYSEKEIEQFHKKYTVMITTGVVLILIGILISIFIESVILSDYLNGFDADVFAASCMFLFITIAVPILVYAGLQKGKYNIEEYNLTHDKESDTYKRNQLQGKISGCIMLAAVTIYLITGFVFDGWGMPYFAIFPVFAIICGIVSLILDVKYKK